MRHEVKNDGCLVCLGVPGDSLPLECPGVQLSSTQRRRVAQGLLDFRMGEWWDTEAVPTQDGLTTTVKELPTYQLDKLMQSLRESVLKLRNRMLVRAKAWAPEEPAAQVFRDRLLRKLEFTNDVNKLVKLCCPYYSALRIERSRRDRHTFDTKLEVPCTSGQLHAFNRKAQETRNTLANWARLTLLRALRK